MIQSQYRRLLAYVKINESLKNDLEESARDFSLDYILIEEDTIIVNYHFFTTFCEDCEISDFEIKFILDPASKDSFKVSEIN